jgi:hypothetical protein
MQKKLTITVDEAVYNGLHSVIGRGNISRFIERIAKPYLLPHESLERHKMADAGLNSGDIELLMEIPAPERTEAFQRLLSYKAMAADTEREREADEWCEAMIGDIPHETW